MSCCLQKLNDGQCAIKKIVSFSVSHSVFSLLFSPDDLAMQASVVCQLL